jgi:hypothetical protein
MLEHDYLVMFDAEGRVLSTSFSYLSERIMGHRSRDLKEGFPFPFVPYHPTMKFGAVLLFILFAHLVSAAPALQEVSSKYCNSAWLLPGLIMSAYSIASRRLGSGR